VEFEQGKRPYWVFISQNFVKCTDFGKIWHGGVPNFAKIDAMSRPCGAKNLILGPLVMQSGKPNKACFRPQALHACGKNQLYIFIVHSKAVQSA